MSIKKCIMNYFDKATNAMVPFHPQTESGAITDWHESIIGSLASKVLPTVVSELTTDSVMGKLMKMLLNASGVKYSIDTNGYVCLGSFFGGLIIQWGKTANGTITWPISFLTTDYTCAALKNSDHGGAILNLVATEPSLAKIEYEWVSYYGGSSEQNTAPANGTHVIAIGH